MFRSTKSMQISFSLVFPVLNCPSTVTTESSQEPGYLLSFGQRSKVIKITKGKRINVYQVPPMDRHCYRFVCRLYLTYLCPFGRWEN